MDQQLHSFLLLLVMSLSRPLSCYHTQRPQNTFSFGFSFSRSTLMICLESTRLLSTFFSFNNTYELFLSFIIQLISSLLHFVSFHCCKRLVLMSVISPMPRTEGEEWKSLPLRIRVVNFSHQSVKNNINGLQINTVEHSFSI